MALVLELLAGGSLAALLARRGRLRPGEVVTAIAPVAAALAHAHGNGVVHGDLSPGNIVFTAEGRPVLTDLGVARVLGEAAAAEVTPPYVDPTVARGGAPGPASDVFGIAAAAFHALTGVAPWNAATPADTLAVAAAGCCPTSPNWRRTRRRSCVAVIERGLSADPHDRGSAAAFALDLRHACRPEPVRLPADGVPDASSPDRAGAAHRAHPPGARPSPPAGTRRRRPPGRLDRWRARPRSRPTGGPRRRRRRSPVCWPPAGRGVAGVALGSGSPGAGGAAEAAVAPTSAAGRRTPAAPAHPPGPVDGDAADRQERPDSAAEWTAVRDRAVRAARGGVRRRLAGAAGGVYAADSPLRRGDEEHARAWRGGARCSAGSRRRWSR